MSWRNIRLNVSALLHMMKVKKYYEESRRDHERIGLIFLTETGHPDERLLGILTSWLIIGN